MQIAPSVLACMKACVKEKQEQGELLIDVELEELTPEYLEYLALSCMRELKLTDN